RARSGPEGRPGTACRSTGGGGAVSRRLSPRQHPAHRTRPRGDRLKFRQPRGPTRGRRLDVSPDGARQPAAVVARLLAPVVEVPAAPDASVLREAILSAARRDAAAGRGVAGTARGGGAVLAGPGSTGVTQGRREPSPSARRSNTLR